MFRRINITNVFIKGNIFLNINILQIYMILNKRYNRLYKYSLCTIIIIRYINTVQLGSVN